MIFINLVTTFVLFGWVHGVVDILPIPIKKAPYQVSIVLRSDKSTLVGVGAILNEHWAVTTATSIKGHRNKAQTLMVRSGSGNYNKGGGLHVVKRILVNPDFDKVASQQVLGKGDIALIRIADKFHFSETVAPIPTPNHLTPDNTTAHLVSWLFENGKKTNKALEAVVQTTENWVQCRQLYYEASQIALDERTLCASGNDKAQEGSPLISRAKLIGLLRNSPSPTVSLPQWFIDVSSYKTWIDVNIAG